MNVRTAPALPAGNPTTDGTRRYVWSASGRLIQLSQGSGSSLQSTTYRYNGFAQRVRKIAASANDSREYAYDEAGHLLGEYNAQGKALAEHLWLGDTPLALVATDTSSATPSSAVYYVFADQIDTPRLLTDANGRTVWSWEGEGFGRVQPNENPDGDAQVLSYNLRFPGQLYDKESGLYYNWHRYYDPATGRYVSSDPIGLEGGVNTYGYVGGNPLRWVDPLGLEAGVTIWQPVGWGGSSFGHVSSTVNGTTYSYGPGGMSIMPKSDYLAKNGFRDGSEVNLNLTPQQEAALQACLKKPQGDYNAATNNCGTPIQKCLAEIGVNDFYKLGNSTIGINGRHVLPVDLGNGLLSSGSLKGTTQYPASRPAGGISAPWAR